MRWSWGRDLIDPAAQALAEALCLEAYLLVLTPPDAQVVTLSALLLLFVPAAWTGRVGRLAARSGGRGLLAAVSVIVVPAWWVAQTGTAALTHLPTVSDGDAGGLVAVALLGMAIWCRGLWLGWVAAGTETLTRRFLVGSLALISLAILLALARGTGVERYTHSLQLLILGYFVVGPAMLALAHLQALHDRGTTASAVSLRWILALVMPMATIVAVGLLLTHDLAPALTWAMHGAARVLSVGGWLLWWLVHPLVALIQRLLSLLVPTLQIVTHTGPLHIPPPRPVVSDLGADQSAGLPNTLLLIPAALLAMIFVRLLLRRTRARAAAQMAEERMSLWSWRLFRQQLHAAYAAWRDHRATLHRSAAAEAPVAERDDVVDMRGVYRALLRWAATNGHARRPATTPRELCGELAAAVPEAAAAVTLITDHYEDERYGDSAVSASALAAANAARASLVGGWPGQAL